MVPLVAIAANHALTMPWIRIESGAYWFLFVASFIGVAIWESFRPKSTLHVPAERRWSRHAVLLIVCTAISFGLFRVSPVIMAAAVANSRFGLLNKSWLPFPARCILAILVLDLVKYTVHWAHHSVSFLWRVHQVHHSDPDFDVSTGLRAHPIEVILMQGANLAAVAILAPPLLAVLIAELTSCFQSFFGHANACLPRMGRKTVAVGVRHSRHASRSPFRGSLGTVQESR